MIWHGLRARALVGLTGLLMCWGCGYLGAPLPPALNLPNRVTDLAAVQRGSKIIAQFTMPKTTTEAFPIKDPPETELRIGPSGPVFDEATWYKNSTRLPDQGANTVYETPSKPFEGKTVLIALRLLNDRGHDAGWSKFVPLDVVVPIPDPGQVTATATQTGVAIAWTGSGAPLYRVYRNGIIGDFQPIGETKQSPFLDTTAEFGKPYSYFVQGVQKAGDSANQSDLVYAQPMPFVPVDTFPPEVPLNLKAIIGAKSIELSWSRGTEPDLAGYRVYRAEADGALTLLADKINAPSYSDRAVKPGVRYRYTIAAFDQAGNASPQSAAIEAMLP